MIEGYLGPVFLSAGFHRSFHLQFMLDISRWPMLAINIGWIGLTLALE